MSSQGAPDPDLDSLAIPAGIRPPTNGGLPDDDSPRRRPTLGMVAVVIGITVFGGILWYAYSQGRRAGTESVAPILRADPGPTKVRPEQPGGLAVPHQDKLVYERLNPGAKDPVVERLLPPPEAPMERPEPPATVVSEAPPEDSPALPAEDAETEPPAATAPPTPLVSEAPPPAAKQAEAPPTTPVLPPPTTQSAASPAAPPAQVAATAPPPVPKVEPKAETKPEPKPAAVTPPPAPAPPAAGGSRLQLAAVDSESKALTEWTRLQRRFPAELGSLGVRFVRVELPKGTYYRIQAGPLDDATAQKVCAALKAQNAGCILVKN